MIKIDVLGKESSTIILDLNDYTVQNVLVRGDVRIIDAIKIAEKTVKKYIKDIEDDYDGVLDWEIIGIKKDCVYLKVDKSGNEEHIFKSEKTNDADGISEKLWIVDIEVVEHEISVK